MTSSVMVTVRNRGEDASVLTAKIGSRASRNFSGFFYERDSQCKTFATSVACGQHLVKT